MRRLAFVLAAALVLPAAAGAQHDLSSPRLQAPEWADLARAPADIPDVTLTSAGVRRLLGAAEWGGQVRVATGETVTVRFSETYPEDATMADRWANFLGGLVHGRELSRLTAYFAPPGEVARFCGADGALACYSPEDELLVAPGEDPDPEVSAESVVAHEYGHHVARNRSNVPWRALDYGAKYWASAMDVCARARGRELYPGTRVLERYHLDPGEGFAESYRLLNERKAGIPESAWDVVSRRLYPHDAALTALERDVADPWVGPSTTRHRARHTRAGQTRAVSVATPLDGVLTATVRAPRGTRLQVNLLAGSRRVARARTSPGGTRRVTTTVCGERTHRLVVRALSGTGTFRLDVSKP